MPRQTKDPYAEHEAGAEQARADLSTFEADPGMPLGAGATAAGYIRATAPAEDGREPAAVTFVPGELLPAWAAEQLRTGQATWDADDRVWVLASGHDQPVKGKRS